MVHDGGRVGRWAPPTLELPRVSPQLPGALDGGVELGGDRHGEGLGVLADARDGHGFGPPLCSSASISPIRSMRSLQMASNCSSRREALRMVSTLPLTSCSRPLRSLVTSPAPSSTATCF